MNWNFKPIASICCIAVVMATSCTSDPNSPGVEYMPDMYRSHAVEAYIDYDHINKSSVRKPVPGTIPFTADSALRYNVMPYIYPNTPAGYEAAAGLVSPIATTAKSLEEGKVLYNKFCMHCHGEKGMGDGATVTAAGYPTPPAYSGPQLGTLPEGKMFHSLTFGKNLAMPAHASQLTKLERWKIIQYVKVLQTGKNPVEGAATTAPAAGDSTKAKL